MSFYSLTLRRAAPLQFAYAAMASPYAPLIPFYLMKKSLFISAALIILLSGCNPKSPQEAQSSDSDSNSQNQQTQQPAPKTVNSPVVPTVITAGNHGWFKFARNDAEIEKCLDINGCIDNKKRVLPGVEKRKDEK